MPYADLTDCRCYYELRGEGDPLLMIPGLGCTTRFWDPIADELGRDFCLVMPETRGVGRSEAKRTARSLRDYTADLLELLDHLQLERVHVLGQSLGGITAQRFDLDDLGAKVGKRLRRGRADPGDFLFHWRDAKAGAPTDPTGRFCRRRGRSECLTRRRQ